jgi:tetratricopeptide (TPR) repeat protein
MARLSVEEIRKAFSNSSDFNELLEAFREALEQQAKDIELYRRLFWNPSLSPDELRFFGEKLAKEMPALAFDVYMWLANVFEVTHSAYDNFELAIEYYRKASSVKPDERSPYLSACDCYDSDLNIPPIDTLIEFLQEGLKFVVHKNTLFLRLSHLYHLRGDEILSSYYRRRAEESGQASI